MREELDNIKLRCATGELLTEGQARWLVQQLAEARVLLKREAGRNLIEKELRLTAESDARRWRSNYGRLRQESRTQRAEANEAVQVLSLELHQAQAALAELQAEKERQIQSWLKEAARNREAEAERDASLAGMREALKALRGSPRQMMEYCQQHGLDVRADPVSDYWREQIAGYALSSPAGTLAAAVLAAAERLERTREAHRKCETRDATEDAAWKAVLAAVEDVAAAVRKWREGR